MIEVSLSMAGIQIGPSLTLERAPLFLRFVCHQLRAVDALDQLDDEPRAGEELVAARLERRERIHVLYSVGRQRGRWLRTAHYRAVQQQPPEHVLRDTAAWRAWCLAEQAREREAAQA